MYSFLFQQPVQCILFCHAGVVITDCMPVVYQLCSLNRSWLLQGAITVTPNLSSTAVEYQSSQARSQQVRMANQSV